MSQVAPPSADPLVVGSPVLLAPGRLVDRRSLAERLPPVAVVGVPLDGAGDPVLPADLVLPAESLTNLRRVEQVPPVVARPVGDDRLQRGRLAGELEDCVRDLLDRLLDA